MIINASKKKRAHWQSKSIRGKRTWKGDSYSHHLPQAGTLLEPSGATGGSAAVRPGRSGGGAYSVVGPADPELRARLSCYAIKVRSLGSRVGLYMILPSPILYGVRHYMEGGWCGSYITQWPCKSFAIG